MLINDLLLPGNIRPFLTTKLIAQEIFHYQELPSTNTEAKRLASENLTQDGAIVIAETQNNGQGRLGRGWYSPFGKGVWVSIILRPAFKIAEAAKCTLLAAVAANRAIEDAAKIACGIKWPNDILHNGRKLVGILSELGTDKNRHPYIVIGVGINVNIKETDFPTDLGQNAISLLAATGQIIDRVKVLTSFVSHFERLYITAKQEGFAPVLDEWRSLCVTLGQEVSAVGQGETFNGIALDIDDDGALLIKTETGVRRVLAADVSIRNLDEI